MTTPPLFAAHPHPINLNVGMIRGGDWPSTVAGECVTDFRLACYPDEPVAGLKERVERTVATAAASPRPAPRSRCSTRASSARATSWRPTRRS